MFERYTEKARRVIFFARFEAGEAGSPFIEPEHMLLGLLREDKALMSAYFPGDLAEEVRQEIIVSVTVEKPVAPSVDLPLSPPAKRVLAYGAEEAERLASKQIETVHLLLGLLREPSKASEILQRHGVTVTELRNKAAQAGNAAYFVARNREIVQTLRRKFAPLTGQLTPDIEPALQYSLMAKQNQ